MLLAFVDTPQRHGRLTVYPIVATDEPQLSYLLMTDALRRGVLTIQENGQGEPPHLIARNRGSQPILILDCESLAGQEVHHTTHQSVLLGPGSTTKVPISCVAPGKWNCQELDERFSEVLSNFPILEHQVGVLAYLGQHLLGLDALGTPELYSPLHRRLLTGYLITTLAAGEEAKAESQAEATEIQALARDLERAIRVEAPCPGSGEYSILLGAVTGGELRHNGHLVHLSVFPAGVAA